MTIRTSVAMPDFEVPSAMIFHVYAARCHHQGNIAHIIQHLLTFLSLARNEIVNQRGDRLVWRSRRSMATELAVQA